MSLCGHAQLNCLFEPIYIPNLLHSPFRRHRLFLSTEAQSSTNYEPCRRCQPTHSLQYTERYLDHCSLPLSCRPAFMVSHVCKRELHCSKVSCIMVNQAPVDSTTMCSTHPSLEPFRQLIGSPSSYPNDSLRMKCFVSQFLKILSAIM